MNTRLHTAAAALLLLLVATLGVLRAQPTASVDCGSLGYPGPSQMTTTFDNLGWVIEVRQRCFGGERVYVPMIGVSQ